MQVRLLIKKFVFHKIFFMQLMFLLFSEGIQGQLLSSPIQVLSYSHNIHHILARVCLSSCISPCSKDQYLCTPCRSVSAASSKSNLGKKNTQIVGCFSFFNLCQSKNLFKPERVHSLCLSCLRKFKLKSSSSYFSTTATYDLRPLTFL